MENDNGLQVWNNVLESAMKLPFVRINRTSFLTKELKLYTSNLEDIHNKKPEEIINALYIDKIAKKCINYHLTYVTGISAVSGIPGGFAMIGTVPTDIVQYYGHILALTQKLAYLYGYGDFTNDEEQLSDDTLGLLTLFIGIGFGSQSAGKALAQLSKTLTPKIAHKIAARPLTKTALYPIIKKVASNIGVKITKGSFAKTASKIIPVLGALTSGSLTYITFRTMSRKINENMCETMMDRIQIAKNES